MAPTGGNTAPRFCWQGLLILLPVFALAAFGLFSLAYDQRLAQLEAQERAQLLADQLADELWAFLTDSSAAPHSASPFLKFSPAGALLSPQPWPKLPTPAPLDLDLLTPEQSRLWDRLAATPATQDSPDADRAALDAFLQSEPPARFAALAEFRRASSLARAGDSPGAARAFEAVANHHPLERTETGLPLASLAWLRRLDLAASLGDTPLALVDQACSSAIAQPSFLTPRILDAVAKIIEPSSTAWLERWRTVWEKDERARSLAAAPIPSPLPLLYWLPAGDGSAELEAGAGAVAPPHPALSQGTTNQPGPWLLVRVREEASGWTYRAWPWHEWVSALHPQRTVTTAGPRVVAHWRVAAEGVRPPENAGPPPASTAPLLGHLSRWPDYFDFTLTVAGRAVVLPSHLFTTIETGGGKGGGPRSTTRQPLAPPPPLASASKGMGELLQVQVHLVNPRQLFARQRERSTWFGLLIAAAALVALLGFLSARRAFFRQQHLAQLQTNFVSSVSHELRAPIASMRLMAEGLASRRITDPAKQLAYFHLLVQECRRLSSMIDNVLDLARMEQGRKQYEFEPIDLVRLVEATTQLMEPAAAAHQVRLETELSATLQELQPELDAGALQQALVNLIDNAIKHSPAGQRVVLGGELAPAPPSANGWPSRPEGPVLRLWVQDRGPGIPREEQAKVFERFYRRGSELRRETQGIGIGLSIVKHVVEAHHGTIQIESDPGHGCRFVVELPLAHAGSPRLAAPPPEPATP